MYKMHHTHDNGEGRNRASETASGMQHITRAGCLGTGQSAENERQFPVVIGGASGAIPRTATTRPCRGSTQQETQQVETVSQAMLGTSKPGKPRQRIHWSEEMNTFFMRHLYNHQIRNYKNCI